VLARKAEWIKNACLAAALLLPAVASLHAIALAAFHRDGTSMCSKSTSQEVKSSMGSNGLLTALQSHVSVDISETLTFSILF